MTTSSNPYRALLSLLPGRPLQVGEVVSIAAGVATIELPGGATIQARGTASVGDMVFVRDGAIEGSTTPLTVVEISV